MKVFRIIIPVKNLSVAEKFYSHILHAKGVLISEGRIYFNLDSVILALYSPVKDGDGNAESWTFHSHQYIYIVVKDLKSARKRCLQAHAQEVTPIEKMPWGETLFYIKDPEGTPISFVQEGTEIKDVFD